MGKVTQSECYNANTFFWKAFGIWPGKSPVKIYRYYSYFFVNFTLTLYMILLTLNLIYCPKKIELLIPEVIFYFTVWAVVFKVVMIFRKRDKITEILELLDCEQFQGNDETAARIVNKNISRLKIFYAAIAISSNFAYVLLCILPTIYYFIGKHTALPVCQYYFLSDEVREQYFYLWLFYLSLGIYVHMTYNVNVDTFIAGLMSMAIVQLKILRHNLSVMKLTVSNSKQDLKILNQHFYHYELILKYSTLLQDIISLAMFVQVCMAACIIGVVALIMVISSENLVFNLTYLIIMTSQIFVPTFLGTLLTHESEQLTFAAYSTDWIPRSESYKRSLRLFVERTHVSIEMTGLKMFPLSLSTFTSIVKMAYSFFALVRQVQDRQT